MAQWQEQQVASLPRHCLLQQQVLCSDYSVVVSPAVVVNQTDRSICQYKAAWMRTFGALVEGVLEGLAVVRRTLHVIHNLDRKPQIKVIPVSVPVAQGLFIAVIT